MHKRDISLTFGVFSLYFSTLQKTKQSYERLSFKTQLTIEVLCSYNGYKKILGNILLRNRT